MIKDIGVFTSSGAIGLPNDSISSLRVGRNVQAIVCKDNDFKGDCILLTGDVTFLNNNRVGNDTVSSAKVQPIGTTECEPGSNQASFFMHAGFLAPCVVKSIGNFANASAIGLDDRAYRRSRSARACWSAHTTRTTLADPLNPSRAAAIFLAPIMTSSVR